MKGCLSALTILLLLCIFTAGCMELDMLMSEFQEPLGSVCTSPAATVLEPSGLDPDHCYQQVAVNAGDLPLCSKIQRGAPMTKCYLLIAVKTGNSSICNDIPQTGDPTAYLPIDCLWEVALATQDPAVCDEMGSTSISRMSSVMSREACLEKIGGGTRQSLEQMYKNKSENFRQCQDLAYASVFNKAPATTTGASKELVGEQLLSSAYTVTSKGCVEEGATPTVPLSNGDIIVFDWDTLPDPKKGAHYAVVENGKISQILNFANGGAFNQTGDISWFFSQRTVYDPYNNNQPMTSPRVYHCYSVYRRTGGAK